MTEMNKNIGIMVERVDDFTDMPNTPSLDLPPQIQSLVDMPEQTFNTPMYQEGGMVRPAGVQMQSQGPRNGQALEMEINQLVSQNPEILARIRAGIEAGLQTGELSM